MIAPKHYKEERYQASKHYTSHQAAKKYGINPSYFTQTIARVYGLNPMHDGAKVFFDRAEIDTLGELMVPNCHANTFIHKPGVMARLMLNAIDMFPEAQQKWIREECAGPRTKAANVQIPLFNMASTPVAVVKPTPAPMRKVTRQPNVVTDNETTVEITAEMLKSLINSGLAVRLVVK